MVDPFLINRKSSRQEEQEPSIIILLLTALTRIIHEYAIKRIFWTRKNADRR